MSAAPVQAAAVRKPSLLHTVKAVACGFFGVRKSSDDQEHVAKLTPLHIIAVGFVAVALLVAGLILLVRFVVAP